MDEATCFDRQGDAIRYGDKYFPMESDPCTQCTCLKGIPEMCISVFCSPPKDCEKYHAEDDKCCQFVCNDENFAHFPGKNSSFPAYDGSATLTATNLGLRLVASAITSLLILALLLFMINRLRRRRLLLMIRRLNGGSGGTSESQVSRRFSLEDDATVGYFFGQDHIDFGLFDDPPPPYAFWKPPETYISPGEAPPSYTVSVEIGQAPYSTISLSHGRWNSQEDVTFPPLRSSPDGKESTETPLSECQSVDRPCMARSEDEPPYIANSPPPLSISSGSITTENEVENASFVGSDNSASRFSAEHEDTSMYMLNNAMVLCIKNRRTPCNLALKDEDVVNGNMLYTPTSLSEELPKEISLHSSVSSEPGLPRDIETTTQNSEKNHHSYSAIIEYWKHRLLRLQKDKKKGLTLQTKGIVDNNIYPDPTTWCSDLSSSSSPTYEQQNPSPSSSNSSSLDIDFVSDTNMSANTNSSNFLTTKKTLSISDSTANKNNSLDRTLQQMLMFSVHQKNKKKMSKNEDKKECPEEVSYIDISSFETLEVPSETNLCSNSIISVKANPIFQDQEDFVEEHPEPLNPNIKGSLSSISSGINSPEMVVSPIQSFRNLSQMIICPKSTSASLKMGSCQLHHARSAVLPAANNTLLASQENHKSISSAVVSVSCCTETIVNHYPVEIETSCPTNFLYNFDEVEACIVQQCIVPYSCQESQLEKKLSRSGSVCSETGERKFVHNSDSANVVLPLSEYSDAENEIHSSFISTEKQEPVGTSGRQPVRLEKSNSLATPTGLQLCSTRDFQNCTPPSQRAVNISSEPELGLIRRYPTGYFPSSQCEKIINEYVNVERMQKSTYDENTCLDVAELGTVCITPNWNHIYVAEENVCRRTISSNNSDEERENCSVESGVAHGARPRYSYQRSQNEKKDKEDLEASSKL
ncbi:uncharacterized protein LOC106462513 isoform X2 [Limulus polyphemus]|nr:uncharacterized protein LOC106462513 isoform X2 [Limulus polyphemus]XP_022245519.1 uncharacterized protein LOC106462513 isoform X2 [Limulus polyphemus]XP_022245520.1 uncharacterized protein LOC106462513 isoform X2 [Limulus polyphemus]